MMDELKLVLDIIKSLPEMAIWALVILYAYKITIIGSVYAVIRFVTLKLHDYLVTKKADIPKVQEINFADIFNGIVVRGDEPMASLTRQIRRIQGVVSGETTPTQINTSQFNDLQNIAASRTCYSREIFITKVDVDWLRDAIDEKLEKDAKNG
ncbi:MAG: hypothetical protein PHT07_20635 [Paludibacter sp.]|nr:hypothetical protein [Paludibacter sp.]